MVRPSACQIYSKIIFFRFDRECEFCMSRIFLNSDPMIYSNKYKLAFNKFRLFVWTEKKYISRYLLLSCGGKAQSYKRPEMSFGLGTVCSKGHISRLKKKKKTDKRLQFQFELQNFQSLRTIAVFSQLDNDMRILKRSFASLVDNLCRPINSDIIRFLWTFINTKIVSWSPVVKLLKEQKFPHTSLRLHRRISLKTDLGVATHTNPSPGKERERGGGGGALLADSFMHGACRSEKLWCSMQWVPFCDMHALIIPVSLRFSLLMQGKLFPLSRINLTVFRISG